MREVKDITSEIRLTETSDALIVSLQSSQYQLGKIEQYKLFLERHRGLLKGVVETTTEEILSIHYKKTKSMQSIEAAVKGMDNFERLVLAHKVHFLVDFFHVPAQPFIHPANIFVLGEELFIGHRGFLHAITPYTTNEVGYLKQYRALVLSILNPKLNYEHLIEGNGTLKDALSQQIQNAQTIDDITQLVGEQIAQQKMQRRKKNKVVKKNNYIFFKWSSLLFAILAIGFSVIAGNYALNLLPAQERISTASAQYIANDYAGVLRTLREDTPEALPKEAKYVVAVSSVQLDNLSNEQKGTILNNLSQSSADNTLLYWIYIGKGDFDRSLDIAQNIGDNQYILHAYTKLYDATRANNTMNGEEKQKRLTQYEEEITKYMEVLGGEADSEGSE